LLTGNVWKWFMANEAIPRAMDLVGFSPPPVAAQQTKPAVKSKKKTPAKRK